MGREWRTGHDGVSEALQKGKPAETDRRHLKSLSHSFTLDKLTVVVLANLAEADPGKIAEHVAELYLKGQAEATASGR